MLNILIRWSLRNRAIVLCLSLLIVVMGFKVGSELPVEVLPDLTKPTVTILTEAPGLSPEEVESLVTQPIENAMMGVAGLTRLRSASDIALSLVFAEFEWGTDIYRARQFVQERLQVAREQLPEETQPYLTPVASLMGEILLIGVKSADGKTAPMDLRTVADWTIRMRLQAIPGVAEVLNMGGGVKQAQVQPDPWRMQAHGVTIEELEDAVSKSASNTTGGFIDGGPQEIMVRNLAMTVELDDIARTIIKMSRGRPIAIADVASVVWGTEPKRGDAAVGGSPGVIMSVIKAPGFDTIALTEKIEAAIEGLSHALPEGVEATVLFRQRDFIDAAIGNLKKAIIEGAVMVTVVLLLFLLSVRTTFITLMAMPLSFAITLLTFEGLGLSVNSMTLGGLAVAIGMVVDDAIVDVENVFRRLRENARLEKPLPKLEIIALASGEVRNSIFYATILIVLVFIPLLGLSGVEGKLFAPIAIATIISMIASFVVSLTTIPVLCSFLLEAKPADQAHDHDDGRLVRALEWLLRNSILRLSLRQPVLVVAAVSMLLILALTLYPRMSRDFLPAFHEETAVVTTGAAPGTSLAEMEIISRAVEDQIRLVPEVLHIGRRIGRAERSDHVMPVNNVEFDIDFRKDGSGRPLEEVLEDIRTRIRTVPGTFSIISGPLSHRISHLLSGVTSPVAVKIFGPDLATITHLGEQVQAIAKTIPGLEDAKLDTQAQIPQLRIELDRARALAHGVSPGELNAELSTLLGGSTVARLRENQRVVDLAIRLPERWRGDAETIRNLPIHTVTGDYIPLKLVADVREATGPGSVYRENTQRRYVVSIKPSARNAGALVEQLEEKVRAGVRLPEGCFISYEGDFRAEQAATRRIAILFAGIVLVIVLLLWSYFRSINLALQVLLALPLALMGSLAFTWWLVGNISIATLVGFIAVGGVAARNGIMMISHYLRLMKHEGEGFTYAMIERGTLERFVPVTMTALSAGIALVPFVVAMGEPGKEILGPVAVCIVGGLVSSTLLDFAVRPAVFRLFGRKAAAEALALDAPATR
ncbi:efflux RND transporter permease subunit [Opitutales bacterium ASA1]|uniref:efflux RND transporter permease subunit n=1 Tax=Congregicoccus parvus TaxID=3081749 RepID=UPI002B2D5C40|nr:efflux RND transporter permease subunit [Opitutales bacterium ASA1]